MRTRLPLLAALVTLVLAGAGCGDDGSDDVAHDPPGATTPGVLMGVVPEGPVRTVDLATVMDTGTGPELCLGPVAESYPPQCGGPALAGWQWADHEGTYDQQGEVRWGTYALTGTWDGTSFHATDAVPGALYDPAASTPSPTPAPATAYDAADLERIASELQDQQWVLGAYGGEGTDGHVLADVVYDDGSLQEWADQKYGDGVVVVSSALVDVEV